MAKYNKLWGSLLGAILGLAAAFGLDMAWFTPELQSVAVGVLSALGAFLAPKNA